MGCESVEIRTMAIQTRVRRSRQEGGEVLCNGFGIVRRSEENLGLEDASKERIAERRRRRRRSKEGDENCPWNLNIPDDGAGRKRAKQEWNSSVGEEFDKNPSAAAAVGRVREPTEVSMVASNTEALGKQVLMEIMTAESCSSQEKTEPMSKEPETIELSR